MLNFSFHVIPSYFVECCKMSLQVWPLISSKLYFTEREAAAGKKNLIKRVLCQFNTFCIQIRRGVIHCFVKKRNCRSEQNENNQDNWNEAGLVLFVVLSLILASTRRV